MTMPQNNPIGAVRAGYDRWAAIYDHDGNPLQAMEEPVVRQMVGEAAGRVVLDLGCGTGRHARWLAEAGAEVTGVDFSEGMLAEARRKPGAGAIRYLAHDLHEPLPFDAGRFDGVVCGLVLEHVRDLPPFFAEAHRVVRPGGWAVFSAMHPAMMLKGVQARFIDPGTGRRVCPGSLAHQISDFLMAALDAGFRLQRIVERAPDAALAARFPRARKHLGWPMLVAMRLAAAGTEGDTG